MNIDAYDEYDLEDQETQRVHRRVSRAIECGLQDACHEGMSWMAAQEAAVQEGSKEVQRLLKGSSAWRITDSERNLKQLPWSLSQPILKKYERQRETERKEFEELCDLYMAGMRVNIALRTVMCVEIAEAYEDDPSSVLARLIDDVGLEYLGTGQDYRGTHTGLIFEQASHELDEVIASVAGVAKVLPEVTRRFVSIDGLPFALQNSTNDFQETRPPRVKWLCYEDYEEICRRYKMTPESKESRQWYGWYPVPFQALDLMSVTVQNADKLMGVKP